MNSGKKETKSRVICFRPSPELERAIIRICAADGKTITSVICDAVRSKYGPRFKTLK